MQTVVELPEDQAAALARYCHKAGISQEEAIRQAVDRLVAADAPDVTQEDLRSGFGLWRGRSLDSREYVAARRAEWDEREQAAEKRRGE